MKKLVLILAVAFGASMVACSSSNSNEAAEAAEPAVETVETVEEAVVETPDSVAPADSVAPEATDSVA